MHTLEKCTRVPSSHALPDWGGGLPTVSDGMAEKGLNRMKRWRRAVVVDHAWLGLKEVRLALAISGDEDHAGGHLYDDNVCRGE